jgi:hypothetical protein
MAPFGGKIRFLLKICTFRASHIPYGTRWQHRAFESESPATIRFVFIMGNKMMLTAIAIHCAFSRGFSWGFGWGIGISI